MDGKTPFSAVLENVSPETAKEYLATSLGNPRYAGADKVNPISVAQLAADLTAGRWVFTGESIIFDWNGHLIDGHTRLNAIIKACTPADLLVVRGIDPVAARVIDGGWVRTIAQSLVNGFGFDKAMACSQMQKAIKLVCLVRKDSQWVSERLTRQYIGDFLSRYQYEIESTVFLTTPKIMNNGICKAAIFEAICAGVDPSLLERLKITVSKGTYDGQPETPGVVLRNYLLSDKFPNRGYAYNSAETRSAFSLVQTCIKKYVEGTPMTNLPPSKDQSLYFTEKNIEERNIEL